MNNNIDIHSNNNINDPSHNTSTTTTTTTNTNHKDINNNINNILSHNPHNTQSNPFFNDQVSPHTDSNIAVVVNEFNTSSANDNDNNNNDHINNKSKAFTTNNNNPVKIHNNNFGELSHSNQKPFTLRLDSSFTKNNNASNFSLSPQFSNNGNGKFSNFKMNSPSPTNLTFNDLPPYIKSQENSTSTSSEHPLNLNTYDLIFDVRPYNLYSKSRIANSINLCLPTTLLKRNSFNLINLLNIADPDQEIKDLVINKINESNTISLEKLRILVYDQCSNKKSVSFTLLHTLKKFENFQNKFEVYVLDEGFEKVDDSVIDYDSSEVHNSKSNKEEQHHQDLKSQSNGILATDNSSNGHNTPTQKLHNDSKFSKHQKKNSLSGFTLPSATNFKTKFVQAVKKNDNIEDKIANDSNNISRDPKSGPICSYKYDFTIPDNLSILPNWLSFIQSAKSNDDIINNLYVKFNSIETSEKSRLNKLVSNFDQQDEVSPSHSSHVTSPNRVVSPCCKSCQKINFKIPKGIEFGLKNRYNNIWPYEHSRVKLESTNGEHDTSNTDGDHEMKDHFNENGEDDYFNGNYINMKPIINNQLSYIATQNPLDATIDDFWTSIEQNNVQVIINLDSKPINYIGKVEKIELLKETSNYKLRRLNDRIYHFHYHNWPDFGVPTDFESIIDVINSKDYLIKQHKLNKSVLVHCSAGCGRTGVFITIDSLIQGLNNENQYFSIFDTNTDLIYKLIQHERKQRLSMVQNFDQFIVCYELLLFYLSNVQKNGNYQPNIFDQEHKHNAMKPQVETIQTQIDTRKDAFDYFQFQTTPAVKSR